MKTKRSSSVRRKPHPVSTGIDKKPLVKANQGENPLHESYFPKADIKDLKFYLYPDMFYLPLRKKLAEYTGYTPDNIFCTNGSDEALMLLIRFLTKPDEEVIICPPTFFKYDFYAKFCHANAVVVARNNDFSLNTENIIKSITKKTRMIIVDSPGNPCGATINRKDLKKLLEQNITVVVDECYFEYCQETVADLISKHPNLVITRTFSKWAGMAGLRVGYIIANENVIKGIIDIRFPCYINTISQYFAGFALDNRKKFLKRIEKIVTLRDKTIEKLKKHTELNVYPSKTPFVLVNLNKLGKAPDLQKYLEENNILIHVVNQPLNVALLENCIRVNLSTQLEANIFLSYFNKWVLAQKKNLQ